MSSIRVVIADDEPMALTKLRRLLGAEHDVEIVAECADGASAAHAIATHRPDAVFLDVEMPERDGFEALRSRVGVRPVIVFVTAFDTYAVRAFDVKAADYLLKPFSADRLRTALDVARERLAAVGPAKQTELTRDEVRDDRLIFRSGGRVLIVPLDEVEWIEGVGNYLGIHTSTARVLMRDTMANLLARLNPRAFVRIHRSAIVNVDLIREVRPNPARARIVTLRSGARLRVSRTCRRKLQDLLATAKAR